METPWGGEVGTVAVARPEAWRRWRSGEVGGKGIGEGGEVDLGGGVEGEWGQGARGCRASPLSLRRRGWREGSAATGERGRWVG